MQKELILRLVSAVGDLDGEAIRACVTGLSAQGMDRREMLRSLHIGLGLVSEYYQSGEYFLADLIYAGRVCESALEMPELQAGLPPGRRAPTVLIGLLPGDIHEIGKSLVASVLKSGGFRVVELEASSSVEAFIEAAAVNRPDIVAIGCKNPTLAEGLAGLVRSMRERAGFKGPIILGGDAQLARRREEFGADAYCADALECLDLCLSLCEGKP